MSLIINGEPIDNALVEQEFGSIKSYFESLGNVSCCERDEEFRGYARDNVIAKVLLMQQAEREAPEPDAARVDAELKKMVDEHGGEAQLCRAMGIMPDQLDMLRGHVAQNLRVETLLDAVCGAPPRPADDELERFYDAHTDRYLTEERVHAMHILKNPQKSEDRAGAYDELRQLRTRILAGEDFRELAEAHSDKAKEQAEALADGRLEAGDAQDPVDLGFFKRGELVEEFELVAFSMEPGEVSPVFASAFGYHLVKLIDRDPAVPRPLDEVRAQVEADYLHTWRDDKVRAYVEDLKQTATIEGADED